MPRFWDHIMYPPRPLVERLKTVRYMIKCAVRKAFIPIHGARMLRDLNTIKNMVAAKDGRLTDLEGQILNIARESADHTYFKWWKA